MKKNRRVGPGLFEFLSDKNKKIADDYFNKIRLRNEDGTLNPSGVEHLIDFHENRLPKLLKIFKEIYKDEEE